MHEDIGYSTYLPHSHATLAYVCSETCHERMLPSLPDKMFFPLMLIQTSSAIFSTIDGH